MRETGGDTTAWPVLGEMTRGGRDGVGPGWLMLCAGVSEPWHTDTLDP